MLLPNKQSVTNPFSRSANQIKAVRRRMRGGSQSFLVDANDGFSYVAKFAGNPQGTRTLINEWIYYRILQRLGVATPELRFLTLSDATLQKLPELVFVNQRQIAIRPGLHLGSKYPGDPDTVAVYDFLPASLLTSVVNRHDFLRILVADICAGQTDSRQAVFVRARSKLKLGFQALFIDHGLTFGGPSWGITRRLKPCVYMNRSVYDACDASSNFNQTMHLLEAISIKEIEEFASETPLEWWQPEDVIPFRSLCSQFEQQQASLRGVINLLQGEMFVQQKVA